MTNRGISPIDVEELMERIRCELSVGRERRGSAGYEKSPSGVGDPSQHGAGSWAMENAAGAKREERSKWRKEEVHVNDFVVYHDERFVKQAYRGILKREADATGFEHFLSNLRTARMTKIEVLGRLRYSPEGRAAGVKVKGLLWPFVIQSAFRIPLLGYWGRLAVAIVNLPRILKNFQILEQSAWRLLDDHSNHIAEATNQDQRLARNFERMQSLLQRKADLDLLEILKNRIDQVAEQAMSHERVLELHNQIESMGKDLIQRGELEDRIAMLKEFVESRIQENGVTALRSELAAKAHGNGLPQALEQMQFMSDQMRDILRQNRDHKLNIIHLQRRLNLLLEEARKRLPEPMNKSQIENMVRQEDHLSDAGYVFFEDIFRGTREDIKKRLHEYLPYVREAKAGTEQTPIMDLGCGRGEWLELLMQQGYIARGIDINMVMVQECQDRGLSVVNSDAIDYLQRLAPSSVGMVTGFHIIEHLPHKILLDLLDESMRVLRPGGIAIFETPNPENILVGACRFYIDPSHRHPLPPDLIRFLLESRGFCRVSVLRLHPENSTYAVPEDGSELAKQFNQYFYGPMDYAVVGYKV